MKKISKGILALFLTILALFSFYNLILFSLNNFSLDYYEIDRCLDSGGRWDKKHKQCMWRD